ncbi:VOC family protein [Streptomyces luteolus]|uniref:VOC family protein n=1 Tax=Streptomyces luteolus TaxID=3043615 RepID=A0ABT6T2K5_9ACTN|nr:VOC family protein [Streptomyces sp. B-S-A12]MDI3422106.1 VOC family protein [Streptomyces sp. B-S-A12]
MRLHHVGVSVADLDASLAWYEKVFGFRRGYSFEEPGRGLRGAFALGADGVRIEMLERDDSVPGSGETDPFRASGVHGYHHICLEVDDLDATYAQCVSLGAADIWEPHVSPNPNMRVGYVADLDGNFIELLELTGDAGDLG